MRGAAVAASEPRAGGLRSCMRAGHTRGRGILSGRQEPGLVLQSMRREQSVQLLTGLYTNATCATDNLLACALRSAREEVTCTRGTRLSLGSPASPSSALHSAITAALTTNKNYICTQDCAHCYEACCACNGPPAAANLRP